MYIYRLEGWGLPHLQNAHPCKAVEGQSRPPREQDPSSQRPRRQHRTQGNHGLGGGGQNVDRERKRDREKQSTDGRKDQRGIAALSETNHLSTG